MMFTNFEIILVTFKDLLQFVMATKGENYRFLLLFFCIIQKAPSILHLPWANIYFTLIFSMFLCIGD